MAVLTCISGLNGKLPAAFLLDIQGKKILLDIGEGPEPGVRPDFTGIDHVDAIFLSHGHIDHVGAIDLWAELGEPPVYASADTFAALSVMGLPLPEHARNILPLTGHACILDLDVTLGRSGHAIGGQWVHFTDDGGMIYMADWSRESTVLAFDAPPQANMVQTDISYQDRDQPLCEQFDMLAKFARPGTIFPVPIMARGTEIALRLHEAGVKVSICDQIRQEMLALSHDACEVVLQPTKTQIKAALPELKIIHTINDAADEAVIVLADSEKSCNLLQDFCDDKNRQWQFVFTGHVAPNSRAHMLIANGKGTRSNWNVHPRRQDHQWLREITQASIMVPAFGDLQQAPELTNSLSPYWHCNRIIDGNDTQTKKSNNDY